MKINETANLNYANHREKGFFHGPQNVAQLIALIFSEVAELLEADRESKSSSDVNMESLNAIIPDDKFLEHFEKYVKNTFEDELADIILRAMNLAVYQDVDLEQQIKAKMRYNSLRPHKHGKKY